MAKKKIDLSRRSFLKRGAALGIGAAVGPLILRNSFAASRDRVTIYHSSVADSINPYNHSSSPIYGNWQHVMEPLIELDYAKKDYVGVLAESWQFQGNRWSFKLRKGIKFHNGAPLTSKDVAFSIEKIRDEKGGSLQAYNFKDVTEVQTPDDQTVVFVTKQPLAIFLDRLENRFILSKVAGEKFGDKLYENPIGTGPIDSSATSAAAIWFSPATTTTGAARRISKKSFSKKSRKTRRESQPWNPAKQISSTTCPTMRWRG
jgi:ABC-type transport system substrate-binding protein